MKTMQVQNSQLFNVNEIPFFHVDEFYETVSECLVNGRRLIGLFPIDRKYPNKLIALLADSLSSSIHVVGGEFNFDKLEFVSLADKYPQTNYFECELAENYGYNLINHPWIRPVRKQNVINGNEPYKFYKLDGDEVHEVAVGPIHAGVIEPGHFRFQCHGEMVYNLEINLGYQHRGIEEMMLNPNPKQRIVLAESIAGDTVIGHGYAHCNAIECLSKAHISLRAQVIRSIAEELERIAMHLAGLGGIANDIGFAIVSASYGRLRTLVINSLAKLCGSRFGRGLFIYGGVRFDLNKEKIIEITNKLKLVGSQVESINHYMFSSAGALMRFEGTGTVSNDFARQIGLVGMIARSCGIESDTRTQFPYSAYHYFPVSEITLTTGDVYARARIRTLEINESIRFILEQLGNLPEGETKADAGSLSPDSMVISIVEGWRGEVVHTAVTGNDGDLLNYKIKDPSFNNWYGLSLALQNTPISDFPLCNKSFDLSYAGHDL
jgi:Ni,Fe-hydrogenase III large subunit